jgi:hypothetical protein
MSTSGPIESVDNHQIADTSTRVLVDDNPKVTDNDTIKFVKTTVSVVDNISNLVSVGAGIIHFFYGLAMGAVGGCLVTGYGLRIAQHFGYGNPFGKVTLVCAAVGAGIFVYLATEKKKPAGKSD